MSVMLKPDPWVRASPADSGKRRCLRNPEETLRTLILLIEDAEILLLFIQMTDELRDYVTSAKVSEAMASVHEVVNDYKRYPDYEA